MARVYNSLRPKKFVYKTLEIVDACICKHKPIKSARIKSSRLEMLAHTQFGPVLALA